jgi:hypothetical protein
MSGFIFQFPSCKDTDEYRTDTDWTEMATENGFSPGSDVGYDGFHG